MPPDDSDEIGLSLADTILSVSNLVTAAEHGLAQLSRLDTKHLRQLLVIATVQIGELTDTVGRMMEAHADHARTIAYRGEFQRLLRPVRMTDVQAIEATEPRGLPQHETLKP